MADSIEQEGGGLPDFLRDPIGIPRRRWRWILLGGSIGAAIGTFLLMRWEPSYEAVASILVTSQQIPEEFIQTTVPEDPFSRLNAMVSQVLSRQKLSSLIDEFNLFVEERAELPLEEVVSTMRYQIRISGQGGRAPVQGQMETARVYTISYAGEDPEVSAKVANRLASLFVEAGIKARMERATEISRFLRQELGRSDEVLREQNRQIADFNERYRGELPSELQGNLAKLDRLGVQKQSLQLQIQDLNARKSLSTIQDPNSPMVRLQMLKNQLDQQLAVYTPEHPSVRALQRQIEQLETDGVGPLMVPGGTENIELSVAAMKRQLTAIEAEMIEIDGRVTRTPKRAEELAALSERATVSREKYLDFLRKVNAAELAQTLEHAKQGAQVTVMDRAFPPTQPQESQRKVMVQALIATLGLAIGAALITEMLDPVLVSEDQVERIVGVPILGSVGHMQ